MKKLNYKRLSLTLIITFLTALVPACFESLQTFNAEKTELMLGFPFDFYTIKFALDGKFAIHYNIAGFLADIVVIYLVITLFCWLRQKIKGKHK